ncbi:unnamed protein product [Bursaphelenchus xylophilus]|uniref:(pine wood nematode) hypothetical protein n=1 Tax=Bursaphelenchus xylophilus TaxID=6326 RepID=A0A1I7RL98_BURXY|nr:unnamed protein product [Bursaphelenchus xylophilus]CAG9083266.1 unnamed protein product [Bursaphelenchus xylophilus]
MSPNWSSTRPGSGFKELLGLTKLNLLMVHTDFDMMNARLILEDGSIFTGHSFGATQSARGELVFQTGMVGYIESLSDPSYARQFLTLTYPLIGNYGVPDITLKDSLGLPKGFESSKIWPAALIVDRICPDNEHSHYQAVRSLSDWLRENGVPGLSGIDVRELTKKVREKGSMKAKLIIETDDEHKLQFIDINKDNLVAEVSRKVPETFGSGSLKVLAVDCGLKNNQIRCLANRNCTVQVVPYNYPIHENIDNFDALFLSNGPGDPSMCSEVIQNLSKIIQTPNPKPVFGICLGHQLLAKAAGAKTYKLVYGNRGHNQPCVHADTNRCYITSQNHGFAVDETSLDPKEWMALFTNANDKTNEGIVHLDKPFFSVQFHPEHAAGPTDMEILFDVFVSTAQSFKDGKKINVRQAIKEKLQYDSNYDPGRQQKILVLGSGGLSIGQAGEFDYSGAQAIKALKEEGIRTVLVNPNVATVQTSKGFADRTYFDPINKEYVTDIIKKERPTGLFCTFGGQTALNCAVDLYREGILDKYNVKVLGTRIQTIIDTEDREIFNQNVESIGEKVAPSQAATSVEGAIKAADEIGYPVLVRAAFALGGLGSGFANNKEELIKITKQALAHSNQVLVDKSLKGWKEVEYEVVRDAFDNCVTVCNMENVDPLGIHTGESVVVAPSQTLTDEEYNRLRQTAIKVIRHFGIIGECNIQYALNPKSLEYYIIEVNARLSRSSALASKATGYPLAYIAAKLALGKSLPELRNSVTGDTTACFEPSLDYCVVKIPRWDLSKFARVSTTIGSSMKSVGEVMGIGRSFEEAFQKALRMVNDNYSGFSPFYWKSGNTSESDFTNPTDKRMLALARALFTDDIMEDYEGDLNTVHRLHQLTDIDLWFLNRMNHIIDIYKQLKELGSFEENHAVDLIWEAKKCGFSDAQIEEAVEGCAKGRVRKFRKENNILPCVKQIDTVAGEWPAATNYLYLTYNGNESDVGFVQNKTSDVKNVLVLGSGVYRIGSSVEFDACCVGCVSELKRMGHKTIMVNCNPETVSTDYDICDRLYFEELSVESVSDIYEFEQPSGIILAFGGQAGNNIAKTLTSAQLNVKVTVFGTNPIHIDEAEDRFKFSRALEQTNIKQPQWQNATTIDAAKKFCNEVGYPCLIRPSYVLSGAAMNVAHNENDLVHFLNQATVVAKDNPVVVSKFISDSKEIDVDAVAIDGYVIAMAISEHVENAGIHSGDATLVTPPQDLNDQTQKRIRQIVYQIGRRFKVTGPFNMQLIAKNDELFVIECNLRVSRSFPFVSKTLDFDFVGLATRAMMYNGTPKGIQLRETTNTKISSKKVGVKVPQFSFSRLAGADVVMGVEMVSTGEVACFGKDRYEAYLKGLLSTGFVVPQKTIFLSIGGVYAKQEMLPSVRLLHEMGYEIYASKGTAEFYESNGIKISAVEWPFEEGAGNAATNTDKSSGAERNIADFMANKDFDLMINLPIRGSGAYRISAYRTDGYKTRRMAIDNGIPLVTDIKCAKLYIEAIRRMHKTRPAMNTVVDCISSDVIRRLPGLVDVHVHVRDPGQTHKETWETCTRAAVAGGITTILAMPNIQPPLVDAESFDKVELIASNSALCDYGLYLGATPENKDWDPEVAKLSAGLKMYLNETFATLKMPNFLDWVDHLKSFPRDRPVVCHAEKQTLAAVLTAAQMAQRSVHICHVSNAEEMSIIKAAKQRGWEVTCEVCPHHLFLTQSDLGEGWKEVRPRLSQSQKDVDALWENLEYIDCFATDHAPHTREEKSKGPDAPPGFPGIEYMLPLLLTAVNEGKLTIDDLILRLHTNPHKIFNIPEQPNTYVEVDLEHRWVIPENGGESKAQWTPFAGRKVIGRVRTVVIRGETVFVDGNFVVKPGFGQNIRLAIPTQASNEVSETEVVQLGRDSRDVSPLDSTPRSLSPHRGLAMKDNKLFGKSLLNVEQLDKLTVNQICDVAARFRDELAEGRGVRSLLKQHIVMNMFYENSTRTKYSFDAAAQRLGAASKFFDEASSSTAKGETLEDTMQMMSSYYDLLVIRHPEKDAVKRAAAASKIPVINAGDGTGEHPTQALLDVFTIRDELSSVNGLTIALVGDLKNGRTVHSLAKLLCLYKDITLHYVSPTKDLGMPEEIKQFVASRSTFIQREFTDLQRGIDGVDLIYMTRIQKERFSSVEEYNSVKGSFILTPKVLNAASKPDTSLEASTLLSHRQRPIVMHPLPRVDEISKELDTDHRSAYFRQATNGVYVRMAILSMVLGADEYTQ